MKFILKIIFLSLIPMSFSHSGVADLSLEMQFDAKDGVVLNRQGEFVGRITNNGPDFAGMGSNVPFPISFSTGGISAEPGLGFPLLFEPRIPDENNECFYTQAISEPPPGGTISINFIFNVPPLEANETIECRGVFFTFFQSGTREVTWRIRNNFDTDPIADNNTQTVVFGIPPRSVPVNNPVFVSFLILLTFLIGCKSIKLRQ